MEVGWCEVGGKISFSYFRFAVTGTTTEWWTSPAFMNGVTVSQKGKLSEKLRKLGLTGIDHVCEIAVDNSFRVPGLLGSAKASRITAISAHATFKFLRTLGHTAETGEVWTAFPGQPVRPSISLVRDSTDVSRLLYDVNQCFLCNLPRMMTQSSAMSRSPTRC